MTQLGDYLLRLWPRLSANKQTAFSALRHALTALGGAAIAKGYLSDSGSTELIGALMGLAGAIWGAADEWYAEHQSQPTKDHEVTNPHP
jgi:hypothetical protein